MVFAELLGRTHAQHLCVSDGLEAYPSPLALILFEAGSIVFIERALRWPSKTFRKNAVLLPRRIRSVPVLLRLRIRLTILYKCSAQRVPQAQGAALRALGVTCSYPRWGGGGIKRDLPLDPMGGPAGRYFS